MSEFTENLEVFFGSEVMSLITIGNEVGDENFLGLGHS